jgi:DNA polymerase-4
VSILLVDCDQFFVQCARIADPEGAGREPLLLVGGSADGRGVVTSASYETRQFGVRSGMPTSQALRLCPRARVVPVPRGVCVDKSRDVHEVLQRFSPVVEPASIDEAYIDLRGTEALYRGASAESIARDIQHAVHVDAGITVSIGGGPGKLIAKLAAGAAKPAGVRVVAEGAELEFMRGFDLADIPGIGPVFTEELRRFGLVRVEDALPYDRITLEQWFGDGRGAWLYRRVRGVDEAYVEPDREARSMSREETFARDLSTDEDLESELLALAVRVAHDVRSAGLRARTVTVKLRDADFRTRTAARTVDDAVETDRAIFTIARELLAKLRARRRAPARLIGVALSHFETGTAGQLALFDHGAARALETDRDRSLARASDSVRERFGHRALQPARLLGDAGLTPRLSAVRPPQGRERAKEHERAKQTQKDERG